MAASNLPPITWAQRSDSIYMTIALPDCEVETLDVTPTKMVFKYVQCLAMVIHA